MANTAVEAAGEQLERALIQIWKKILGTDEIGVHDNFFDLEGGDSLSAVMLFTGIKNELGITLPPRSLFQAPTVSGLATLMRQSLSAPDLAIPPIRKQTYPVSIQQRDWLEIERAKAQCGQMRPSVLWGMIRLRGALNLDALRRSFEEVVRRHEALRTRFVFENGEWRCSTSERKSVAVDAWTTADDSEESIRGSLSLAIAKPLDYLSGVLLRLCAITVADGRHLIVPVLARIAADDWTMHLVIREAMTLYGGGAGSRNEDAEPALQYSDFVAWQRDWLAGPAEHDLRRHFDSKLRRLDPLHLPHGRAPRTSKSFGAGQHTVWLSEELSERLGNLAAGEGASPYIVMLGAFYLLLAHWTGQADLAVTTFFSGRPLVQMNAVAGFFACEGLVRVRMRQNASFAETVRDVKAAMRTAEAFEAVPLGRFRQLAAELGETFGPFPVSVHGPSLANWNVVPEYADMDYDAAPLLSSSGDVELPPIHEELRFQVRWRGKKKQGGIVLQYSADAFEATTIAGLAAKLVSILEMGVSDPSLPALSCLRPQESRLDSLEPAGGAQ